MADKKEIGKVLAVLAAAFPNFTLTEERIRLFELTLADIPFEVLEAGALRYITDSRFPPTIAEIREASFELLGGERHRLSGEEAWGEVKRAMSSVGFYRTPEFSEPAIESAVAAVGGWKNLCLSEQAVADRARFIAAYGTISKRERGNARMLPAISQLEQRLLEAMERDAKLVPAKRNS